LLDTVHVDYPKINSQLDFNYQLYPFKAVGRTAMKRGLVQPLSSRVKAIYTNMSVSLIKKWERQAGKRFLIVRKTR